MDAKLIRTLKHSVLAHRRDLTRFYADQALLYLSGEQTDMAEHQLRIACDLLDDLKVAERWLNEQEGVANGT